MAINFPATPTVGDTYTIGLKTFTWDGTRWSSDPRTIVTATSSTRPTVTKPYLIYNTTLRSYEIYLPEYNRWEQVSTYAVIENPTSEYGEASYVIPGTYSWVCPEGVFYVNVVCVGGGGGARQDPSGVYVSVGGAGGGLGWKNNIPVVPGNSYAVVVGAGGVTIASASTGSTNAGGDSYFINSSTVAGFGGQAGSVTTVRLGGTYVGDGGGFGGNSFPGTSNSRYMSGGGGAGGYTGNGGAGAYTTGSFVSATAGSGGAGGGGGQNNSTTGNFISSAGGGVGILGLGTSGAAGTNSAGGGTRGGGGSGGEGGGSAVIAGGLYGGGAGAVASSSIFNGGDGAVRIIWGPDRAFPSTNTGTI